MGKVCIVVEEGTAVGTEGDAELVVVVLQTFTSHEGVSAVATSAVVHHGLTLLAWELTGQAGRHQHIHVIERQVLWLADVAEVALKTVV